MLKNGLIWASCAALALGVTALSWQTRAIEKSGSDPTQYYAVKSGPNLTQNQDSLESDAPLSEAQRSDIIARAEQALLKAPLSDDAMLQIAIAEKTGPGTFTRPAVLLNAYARSARNRNAIKQHIDYQSYQNNVSAMIEDLDLFYRLEPESRDIYIDTLTTLFGFSIGRDAILKALQTDRLWAFPFLQRLLSAENISESYLNSLAPLIEIYITERRDNVAQRWLVRDYLDKLVALGRVDDAYTQWHTLYEIDVEDRNNGQGNLIYNANFTRGVEAPPFNWYLYDGKTGGAEFDGEDGLYVFSIAEKRQIYLRQYVPVPPNMPLTFTMNATGRTGKNNGSFEWRFVCRPTMEEHAKIIVPPEAVTGQSFRMSLPPVSDSCDFIDVQLFGLPGLYPDRITLNLTSVSLTANGRVPANGGR